MASVDLVFAGAPLTQPAHLVFGDDGSNPVSDAVISGTIDLGMPVLSSTVALGIVHDGAIELDMPTLSGELVYYTDTRRPLVGKTEQRFQDAPLLEAGVRIELTDADPLSRLFDQRYQGAERLHGATAGLMRDTQRMPAAAATRFAVGSA